MPLKSRIICRYDGQQKGPLLICFGAMHGNEPAGVKAIEYVMKMLEVEPIKNPSFKYNGRFLGIIGNLKAYNNQQRFLKKDLNRQFIPELVQDLLNSEDHIQEPEEQELIEILDLVKKEIADYKPEKLIVLDLHTTSSFGGVFTICQNNPEVINVAYALHAPIVLGMLEGLKGTTLHYFTKENLGVETLAITFESGQHKEELSVNRAIAGIICLMKEIKSVKEEDVENYHEEIIKKYSEDLPQLTTLVEHFPISENDKFQMLPGFRNFQSVNKNQLLAHCNSVEVKSKEEGLILMPLYQEQGEDGYFIVQKINNI